MPLRFYCVEAPTFSRCVELLRKRRHPCVRHQTSAPRKTLEDAFSLARHAISDTADADARRANEAWLEFEHGYNGSIKGNTGIRTAPRGLVEQAR